jgi:hypothetical protein
LHARADSQQRNTYFTCIQIQLGHNKLAYGHYQKEYIGKKIATKRDKGNPTARTSGMEPMPRNK